MRIKKKIIIIFIAFILIFSGGFYTWAQTQNLEWDFELTILGQVFAYIQWAIPEGRVGAPSTNWDTTFFLSVRDTATGAVLYTMPNLATTSLDGTYLLSPIELGVSSGTYDVSIKTSQHLSRRMRNIALDVTTTLNFTQPDNSPSTGTIRLLAGDINGLGNSTTTLGDDVVNAVDLSVMLGNLDQDDPTSRSIRSNVNQDPVVNSVDLSLLLKNLDVEGENMQ